MPSSLTSIKSLIDTSKKTEIKEVVDIDLSSSEDSVSSLAVARSDEGSAVVLAGINSSIDEQKQGKNDHLRSFVLKYPRRKSTEKEKIPEGQTVEVPDDLNGAMTEALCKSPLFTPDTRPNPETYQRVLRLSRPNRERKSRIGAVTTGLAPIGEVTIFDASKSKIDPSDVRQRINLGKEEAGDVDIVEANDHEYYVAYCTDYEIYVCKVPFDRSEPTQSPYLLYETPFPDAFANEKKRPQFRSLRFLTPKLLLVLVNLPNKSGVELCLLELSEIPRAGTVSLRKALHKGIKSATSLAISVLRGPTPSSDVQHVIAVAGQDISITIFTIDHGPRSRSGLAFKQYALFRNPHPIQMTSLAFSHFSPPADPARAQPQYLKLASTSMSSTIVVHTFPLIPCPSAVAKRSPDGPPTRYVLSQQSSVRNEGGSLGLAALVGIIMVALGAFFLQAVIEIRGGSPEIIGAKTWLSQPLRDKIALPWMFADQQAPVLTDSLPPIESPLRKAYKVVEDSVPTHTDQLKGTVYDAAEGLKGSAYDATEYAKDKADDAKERAYDATDDLRDRAHDAKEGVKDGAYTARDRAYDAKEAVKRRAYDAKEGAKDRAYDAKEGVKNRAYGAKDGVKDRAHNVRDKAYDAKEAVKGRAYNAKDRAYDAAGNIRDKAYNAKEWAYEATEDVKDKAYDKGEDLVDRAHDARESAYETTEDIKDEAYAAAEDVKDRGYDAKDWIYETTEDLRDGAYDAAEGARDKIYDAKDWVYESAEDIRDGAYDTAENARDKTYDAKDWVYETAEDIRDGAYDKAEDLRDSAYHTAERVRGRIPTDTEELRETGRQAARKVKQTAKHGHRRIRDLLFHRLNVLGNGHDEEDDPDIDMIDYEEPSYVYGRRNTEYNVPTIVIRDRTHETDDGALTLTTEVHRSMGDMYAASRGRGVRAGKLRRWEDLKPHEKRSWMRRLEDAGVWTLREGESVLKGVFFSEVAGAVAGAVRAGL